MAKANFLARATRGLARTPKSVWIATAHNTIEGGWLVDLGYRITDRFSDVTTNVSRRAVDRYIRIKAAPAARIRVMYNGIHASRFDRDEAGREAARGSFGINDRFAWLAIGRLEAAKDFPNLFRAVSQITAEHPDVLVLIAGRGILAEELKDMVDSMGLASHIRLIGERTDIPDVLNACDGYVMSSAWEGLPIVLLEAAAAALPVVATDVGGNNELVIDGESGFLVPPHDSDALAHRMSHVMRMNDSQRKALGVRGRKHVETTFDMEHILDRWQELYEEFIAQRGVG
jgi:glycosyltransferase involved in cell wall biosynthesis